MTTKNLSAALKSEIKYQKVILGLPGILELSKPADDLPKDLICHSQHTPPSHLDSAEDFINANELWHGDFQFSNPGTWVAVYYDDKFCIGQTIQVLNSSVAEVKFVEQTKVREQYFRWPRSDDIAYVNAKFTLGWKFDLIPVTNYYRIWRVDCLGPLKQSYVRLKASF